MKNFALIGASGYIAPKHMRAIKDSGNNLIAAMDNFDSVGILDSYFPEADFFTEFERFDRHISKLKSIMQVELDYVSVCTPNYLHDSHIRFALRQGADSICEKPLVLNPWNLDSLQEIEQESKKKIWSVLQLRMHPSIIELKERIGKAPHDRIHDIDLTYITSRGNWYYTSWKGSESKSGGIATNIGVHFFDMLSWIFGELKQNVVHLHEHDRAAGYLEFKKARVRWFLSINKETLPKAIRSNGQTTYRSIKIDGEELEFSNGFTDLHTVSYEQIISGNGFGISETRQAIEIVHSIRHSLPLGLKGDYHPLVKLPLNKHPFLDRNT